MRVVIADDEERARKILRQLLEELEGSFDLHLVGEANNGKQLLQVLETHHPDIAFIDIRMPELSGLEAMQACMKAYPEVIWVIVSGYSEFEYAQQALRLGVFDYVVKPVSSEDLQRILTKAVALKQQTKMQETAQLERYGMHLLHAQGKGTFEQNVWDSQDEVLPLFCVFDACSEKVSNQWGMCVQEIRSILSHLDELKLCIGGMELSDGEYCILMAGVSRHELQVQGKLLAQWICRKSDAFHRLGYAVTVFLAEATEFSHLHQHLGAMKKNSRERIFKGIDTYHVLLTQEQDTKEQLTDSCFALVAMYQQHDYMQFIQELVSFKLHCETTQMSVQEKGCLRRFLCNVFDLDVQQESTLLMVAEAIRIQAGQRIKPEGDGHRLIQQVVSYIDAHYQEEIGIDRLSEYVHMTPNYLSTLFHAQMGKPFIKYLTEKRIEGAKHLLVLQPTLPICEVAHQVGYASPRYFTKKFLQITSQYPNEYRRYILHSEMQKE